jgi:hypothetical protein
MKKTIAVLIFFVAALLAGLFLSASPPAKVSTEDNKGSKETFAQRQVGMPLDMQAAEGVTGYMAASPILGSEPKPTPERPYDMANDQELFQFKDNKVSADCCPSPFSRDGGCVCLTDSDRKLFMTRGGNN